jgi:hypothetical protein
MKTYEVEITGTTALLMHRFGEEAEVDGENNGGTRRIQVKRPPPREQAEKAAYRKPDGDLWFPSAAIARLLREAGGNHKQRGSRKSTKYLMPAAVRLTDEAISMLHPTTNKPLKDFEVDSRPVTIPATKGRIMRHRARLDQWRSRFSLVVNDLVLPPDFIHQLLVEGGMQIGIGDFRPEKGGPFGCFNVTRWQEAK